MAQYSSRLPLIFRYRQYLLYFTGSLISWIGNSMQFIANSWLALQLTGSPSSVAIVLIAAALPGVLLSPILGVYVDRIDRRWLAVITDTSRAVILFTTFLLGSHGLLQAWHLYLMSFLLSLGEVVYNPTAAALLREEIPGDILLYTNTYSSIARQIGGALGAGLGGILISLFSPFTVLFVNALSFLFSALCVLKMRKGYLAPTTPVKKLQPLHHFIGDLQEGFSYIKHHSNVTIPYIIMLFINSTLDMINVVIAVFVKNVLRSGVAALGYMEVAFAIGSITGNLLMPGIARVWGTQRTMTAGVWAMATALLLLAISPNLWMAILSYFLLGITVPVWSLYFTQVQKTVPSHYQGRVHSTFNTFSSLISLLVFSCMGFLAGIVTIRSLYWLQSGLLLIAGIIAYQAIYRQYTATKTAE